ncbi:glycosyltransferase [Mycobacterium tuberculosis]|uniref:Glycosyltransferase family 2 protein n=1 Tax=Stenotrophomonas bentonitica TaxID=1450134 RepID=A0ABU9JNC6_9GAMM|nr:MULTISPECIES: glycosyltransferase family 2 protein [Stenotrophomonas]MDX5516406.1 glycosyltransferase family 2 protein [Stenotrophomonas sp. RG-453]REN00282.1 glycosyltransferase [Mycobacterium tuberculosis]
MKISLVVPVFNEEEAAPIFHRELQAIPGLEAHSLEIIFVNDGSRDQTEAVIADLAIRDPRIILINFSRNFGKEPALLAGIEAATGDVVIPMDVDLQDPLELLPAMIEKYESGAQVVLARRVDRGNDGFLKRNSASYFYRIINAISDSPVEANVGDFRLMSRPVVDAIKRLPENRLFMKGLLSWVGFRTEIVDYSRPARSVGVSKFNGWKLWNFALEGITSFSSAPLRVWTYIGSTIGAFSIIYAVWIVMVKVIYGNPVPGYSSLFAAILFLGAVQLIGIGVLGEYIGRIYSEVKRRPRYIVRSRFTSNSENLGE